MVVQQPVQQQVQTQLPVDEFEGKTASQIAEIANDYYWGKNGKTKDYDQAVKWYRKAAEMGNADAQNNLGICYANGQGVTQEYENFVLAAFFGETDKEALKWYRKAAEQGHSQAQNNLGLCYYKGRGVTKDLNKAKEWWRKSAAQGNQTAKNNLKKYFGE